MQQIRLSLLERKIDPWNEEIDNVLYMHGVNEVDKRKQYQKQLEEQARFKKTGK